MAQKPAKMGHNRAKAVVQSGEKVNHRITGGLFRGYTVVDADGEDKGYRRNMWDAINLRKELDKT